MKAAELRRLLEERGLAPRHRLGQNFLLDPALLKAIPRDSGVEPGDRVLEVGPGAGALTEHLLAAGASVLAVELDRGLAALLRERFDAALKQPDTEPGSLRLIEDDVLAANESFHSGVEAWWESGAPPRLVSNLPYSISGPFLGRLTGRSLAGANLLLQAEVARKAAAQDGPDLGPLSIRLGMAFHVRLGRKVPPEVFWPRPKVDSAFLQLLPREDRLPPEQDRALARLLREAFGQRRKRLLPRIRNSHPEAAETLAAAGVSENSRPEEVPAAAWRAAARTLILPGPAQADDA